MDKFLIFYIFIFFTLELVVKVAGVFFDLVTQKRDCEAIN